MKIEILLTEAEIAQELSESMEARDIPEKFFYSSPHAARAWLELAREPHYDSLRQAWQAIGAKIAAIVGHFGKSVPVISFGAGDGLNDRLLMVPIEQAGRDLQYFPVDASQVLLETACGDAEDQDIETLGIKADISSPVHLLLASDASESPKLLLLSGNTIGAFDPLEQIRHIAQCMHPGDRLIIDGELYDDDAIAFTKSPPMQLFAFGPLANFSITQEDGTVSVEPKRDDRHEGLYLMTRRFRADRDIHTTVAGEEFVMERGARLAMNFRYLYSRAAFRWLLESHGGLKILDEVFSADERFVVAVCSR